MMLPQTTPKLGSFDVQQITMYGQYPLLAAGVDAAQGSYFCLKSEADDLQAMMLPLVNPPTGGYGTVIVSLDPTANGMFITNDEAAPQIYTFIGNFQIGISYEIRESAGRLLYRQTHPEGGIDKSPYADPGNPKLNFQTLNGVAQFYWS